MVFFMYSHDRKFTWLMPYCAVIASINAFLMHDSAHGVGVAIICAVFFAVIYARHVPFFGARTSARARHNIVSPVSGPRDAWLYADRYVLPLGGGLGFAHCGSRTGPTLGVVCTYYSRDTSFCRFAQRSNTKADGPMSAATSTALWVVPVPNFGGVARHTLDMARAGIPGYEAGGARPCGGAHRAA